MQQKNFINLKDSQRNTKKNKNEESNQIETAKYPRSKLKLEKNKTTTKTTPWNIFEIQTHI